MGLQRRDLLKAAGRIAALIIDESTCRLAMTESGIGIDQLVALAYLANDDLLGNDELKMIV